MPCFSRRGLAAVIVLVLAGLPAAVPAQIAPDRPDLGPPARNLRELVGRYFAWRGPAYGQLQSVHERGYFESAAGRRSGSIWMDRAGRSRIESDGESGRDVRIATPDGAWRLGADGKAVDDPGAAEAARRYAALDFGDALTGREGAEVALAGTADVEDHTWTVVRVTFGGADTYDALLDPSIGMLCCYRITEKGAERVVLFNNWRMVDGVRVAFTQLTRRGGADAEGVRLSAVEINPPLDAALFQKPGS